MAMVRRAYARWREYTWFLRGDLRYSDCKMRSGVAVAADLREEIVENCLSRPIFRRWWSQACTRINHRGRLSKILHSGRKSFLKKVRSCLAFDKRLFLRTCCAFTAGLWRYDSTSVDDYLSISLCMIELVCSGASASWSYVSRMLKRKDWNARFSISNWMYSHSK